MKKETLTFLGHILECVNLIQEYTKNKDINSFESDLQLQDAVIRRIEIIGEATRNVPLTIRKKYPEVSWKEMAGMRDILIHHYYGVSLKRTWNVVKNEIPKLKNQIQKIIKELSAEEAA